MSPYRSPVPPPDTTSPEWCPNCRAWYTIPRDEVVPVVRLQPGACYHAGETKLVPDNGETDDTRRLLALVENPGELRYLYDVFKWAKVVGLTDKLAFARHAIDTTTKPLQGA